MPVSFSTSPIRRATISRVTKRGSQRKAPVDSRVKEIVLRVDGGEWHPSTADPGAILSLAAAYVEGLRAVAKASELHFTLKGVTIRDECVAIGIGVGSRSVARRDGRSGSPSSPGAPRERERFWAFTDVTDADPTHVILTIREGALGFEWIESIRPATSQIR